MSYSGALRTQFHVHHAVSFSPAVDRDGSVLSKLLLGFMHLADEVDEALPRFGHALLRPVGELELPHCSGLAVLENQREGRPLGWWQEIDDKLKAKAGEGLQQAGYEYSAL